MYVPPPFRVPPDQAKALLSERGFGLMVAKAEDRFHASHLPFFYRPDDGPLGTVEFHVARGNPLAALAAEEPRLLLAVQGPDAFISASWYASENQVPTWNYISAHAEGILRPVDEAGRRAHVARLSDKFERRVDPEKPWTLDKVADERIQAMLKAIVVLELPLDRLEGQWKLNQHKTDTDHAAVTAGLRTEGGAEVAALMTAARPVRAPA